MRPVFLFVFLLIGLASPAQQFLVSPYLQPGNAPSLSKEMKVVVWETDSVPGNFKVEFVEGKGFEGAAKVALSKISSQALTVGRRTSYIYRAPLTGLKFDADYTYRVMSGDQVVTLATFRTRTKGNTVRFVAFGDMGAGTPQQAAVAYQIHAHKPQFVLATGDLAYSYGLAREFRARFFPFYTASEPSLEKGAPLMQSIPFYLFPGNHDLYGADLLKFPDGLALYYYSDGPMNAPVTEYTTEVKGPEDRIKAFKKVSEGRFPKMNNFSFDEGNVHITALDANSYVNPLDGALIEWMKRDIESSKADWKIVTFHHPGFNSSKAHYDYQQMRLLAPVLESLGVDLVINSHVHNYQRSKPLRFAPKVNEAGDRYVISPEGRVDGKFTLDEKFDGVTHTKADGILYIVSGSGGAGLYDIPISNNPELWKHEPAENWVPFTVKLISDVHSFTLLETAGKTLVMKQINLRGEVLDEVKMTK
jgi:hypothetical protein